jgi:hypothetical protein
MFASDCLQLEQPSLNLQIQMSCYIIQMMFVKSSTNSTHLFSFWWKTLRQWAFLVSDLLKQWKKIFVKLTTNSDYLWISISNASMSVMVCTCSYTNIKCCFNCAKHGHYGHFSFIFYSLRWKCFVICWKPCLTGHLQRFFISSWSGKKGFQIGTFRAIADQMNNTDSCESLNIW